jgi:hypothetical protein
MGWTWRKKRTLDTVLETRSVFPLIKTRVMIAEASKGAE